MNEWMNEWCLFRLCAHIGKSGSEESPKDYEMNDTSFQTQNAKFEPWRSEAELTPLINVLVNSFRFIWIPMLRVYDHYKYFNSFSARIVFIRQNLTSKDARFWRINTVPALKVLKVFLPKSNHSTPCSQTFIFLCVRGVGGGGGGRLENTTQSLHYYI